MTQLSVGEVDLQGEWVEMWLTLFTRAALGLLDLGQLSASKRTGSELLLSELLKIFLLFLLLGWGSKGVLSLPLLDWKRQ